MNKHEAGSGAAGSEGLPAPTPASPGRRRFGRAGLGASGVILSLACKPVLSAVAVSPSGFLSANQSAHGGAGQQASQGRSPAYWAAQAVWPLAPDTAFSQVFSCPGNLPLAACTLAQTLVPNAHDPTTLGMYLTAALLNVRSGWTPFLSESSLLAIFLEWRTQGYFTPLANVRWEAADIVAYLRSTQA